VNFTSILMSVLRSLAAPVPKNLASSPSNAHAYRLYVFNDPSQAIFRSFLALSAAISGAFNYDTVNNTLSNLQVFRPARPAHSPPPQDQAPRSAPSPGTSLFTHPAQAARLAEHKLLRRECHPTGAWHQLQRSLLR